MEVIGEVHEYQELVNSSLRYFADSHKSS
jgi:hypothetical protein